MCIYIYIHMYILNIVLYRLYIVYISIYMSYILSQCHQFCQWWSTNPRPAAHPHLYGFLFKLFLARAAKTCHESWDVRRR